MSDVMEVGLIGSTERANRKRKRLELLAQLDFSSPMTENDFVIAEYEASVLQEPIMVTF